MYVDFSQQPHANCTSSTVTAPATKQASFSTHYPHPPSLLPFSLPFPIRSNLSVSGLDIFAYYF
jgi:hypothetical protein